MRIRIKKHTRVRKRNIFGKPVEVETYYTLDKCILGFISVGEYNFWYSYNAMLQDLQKMRPHLTIAFDVYKNGTHFDTLEDAMFVRRRIYSYPDIFIKSKT